MTEAMISRETAAQVANLLLREARRATGVPALRAKDINGLLDRILGPWQRGDEIVCGVPTREASLAYRKVAAKYKKASPRPTALDLADLALCKVDSARKAKEAKILRFCKWCDDAADAIETVALALLYRRASSTARPPVFEIEWATE